MTNTNTRYAYDTAIDVKIVAYWCNGCGIAYGLPEGFIEARREDHQSWTCPNGCVRHFPAGSSEAERLRAEVKRLEQQRNLARQDRDWQREQRLKAERQRAAAKGQVTKIKNRVAKGVCPCCNRTFANLAAHMAGQHPDYAGAE